GEQLLGAAYVGGAVEDPVVQGVDDGVAEDLDVGDQLEQGRLALQLRRQRGDDLVQFVDLALQFAGVGPLQVDANRRDGADLFGDVVLGAVGQGDGGGGEGDGEQAETSGGHAADLVVGWRAGDGGILRRRRAAGRSL